MLEYWCRPHGVVNLESEGEAGNIGESGISVKGGTGRYLSTRIQLSNEPGRLDIWRAKRKQTPSFFSWAFFSTHLQSPAVPRVDEPLMMLTNATCSTRCASEDTIAADNVVLSETNRKDIVSAQEEQKSATFLLRLGGNNLQSVKKNIPLKFSRRSSPCRINSC